jgi:sodium transport system ATP-binding protein
MEHVLETRQLSRSFGAVHAVQGVDFHVGPGEIVGLLGPNGAGKTTILRMIAGILTPDQGEVRLHGRQVASDPIWAKSHVGFLSGDTQMYQRLSPRESLDYFGRLYGMEEPRLTRRIGELVERLEMGSFADRPCGTLSSGQKQRANIARAFLHEPDLLILDEPTTALDVVSGHFIVEAIRAERQAGRAVLFSTHIMSEAEYLCDRILLLHEGRVVDQGTIPDLLWRSGCANLTDTFLQRAGLQRAVPPPPAQVLRKAAHA